MRSESERVFVRCYTRVSTEEQALSGYSLAAQREHLQSCVERMGWSAAGWYADEGRSAKDLNRPGFRQMMKEARKGDLILVTKLDRLTRSVRDLDELLREFDQRGLQFQSATEQFETRTPGGRLYMGIVAVIAQWEREIIGDRSAAGKRQKVAQGEWAGGPVPFGYLGVPSGRFKRGRELLKLVPDPHKAHVVRQLFERYVRGQGMRSLCIWLNEEMRVLTSGSAKWRVSSLTRILTNPIYAGLVAHGRRTGSPVLTAKGAHPPLVPEELFRATQQMFGTRKQMAPRQATGVYPLAGIARCGVCGSAIDSARSRRKGSYAYRCRHYANGMGCGGGSRRATSGSAGHIVESRLMTVMEAIEAPPGLGRFLDVCADETAAREGMSEAEARRLEAARQMAERAIRQWERAYEHGRIDWAEFEEKARGHKEALWHALQQLSEARAAAARPVPEQWAPHAVSVRAAWKHLVPQERKALLQQFVSAFRVRILLYPDRRVEVQPAAAVKS